MLNMKLRQLRKAKEYSVEYMANALVISPATYSRWEKSPEQIGIGFAIRICKILNVDFDPYIFLSKDAT